MKCFVLLEAISCHKGLMGIGGAEFTYKNQRQHRRVNIRQKVILLYFFA